ncbi:MAG: hypothetical protein K5644_01625 [Lachnospiraceae bacterium]|nr:hypothetical protein [Lachnospiraceae bacterium]
MLTAIFTILLIVVLIQFIAWAVKISWGVLKTVLGVILVPIVFIGLCVGGLYVIAIVGLIILGIAGLVGLIKAV